MVIHERKLRKIGNTVGITLSKEFLESIVQKHNELYKKLVDR